jgi:RNA polymerase sigma-70 factor, ECF subfamily
MLLRPYVVRGTGRSQLGGEEELSRTWYDEHAPALMAFVLNLVRGDRQQAEDIVQETLVRAWRHAHDVPANARRPWLFTTARHLVIEHGSLAPPRSRPTLMDAIVEDDAVVTATAGLVLHRR